MWLNALFRDFNKNVWLFFFIISFEIKSNPQDFLFFKELIAFEISALLIVLSNSEDIFLFSLFYLIESLLQMED